MLDASHTEYSTSLGPCVNAALAYAAKGWHVFPVQNNKKPFPGTHGLLEATTDPETIRGWWRRWPRANVAIACGRGLVVIDLDTYKDGFADIPAGWILPVTLAATTARGGRHLYFAYEGELQSRPEKDGLCVKASGGYVVAPPSTCYGGHYAWVDEAQPLATLPERVAQELRSAKSRNPAAPALAGAERESTGAFWLAKALERARAGARNDTGLWLACQLRDNGCTDPEGTMLQYAAVVHDWDSPYYTDREALATWRSVQRKPAREPAHATQPTPFRPKLVSPPPPAPPDEGGQEPPRPAWSAEGECTDMGNARRFVARHGQDVRHVATWNQWLIWDGKRWKRDNSGEAERLAKETVVSIYQEAADSPDINQQKALAKWAIKSQADARIKAMLSVVQTEPEIACVSEAFDNHPWLLTVDNGTLDLRTGELMPHDRGHLITRLAPVTYDPDADCPTWVSFLFRIMGRDIDLVEFLQRAIGYSLTDDTGEQVLFLLHGSGQNGKSVLLAALEGIMGDYGIQTPTTTLMAKRDNSIPNDVARLKGARFVKAIETEEGQQLAESLVKQMTGGDMLSARFMRGEWFDFRPSFKLWLAANHLPRVRGSDDGIWRRIRYIPFAVQIPEGERDNKLGEKLRAEYSGILAWAVKGCLEWQKSGLGYPDRIRQATSQYREQMDQLGRFIADCCVLGPTLEVQGKALRSFYETWCQDNGERPRSQIWLGLELQRMGIQKYRDSSNASRFRGIGLRLND